MHKISVVEGGKEQELRRTRVIRVGDALESATMLMGMSRWSYSTIFYRRPRRWRPKRQQKRVHEAAAGPRPYRPKRLGDRACNHVAVRPKRHRGRRQRPKRRQRRRRQQRGHEAAAQPLGPHRRHASPRPEPRSIHAAAWTEQQRRRPGGSTRRSIKKLAATAATTEWAETRNK